MYTTIYTAVLIIRLDLYRPYTHTGPHTVIGWFIQ